MAGAAFGSGAQRSRVVKTLNTLTAELMVRPEQLPGAEMYLPLWLRMMQSLATGMFNVKVVRES